jgi:polyisoprenoid-binding protein YceI
VRSTPLLRIALLLALPLAPLRAQQPNPLGGAQVDTAKTQRQPNAGNDSSPASGGATAGRWAPAGFEGVDSVVYRLVPSSRLEVKTGKAGLFGFAGHTHVIRARAFSGNVVYYPHAAARSHLQITVQTDSLEVLTPPDTAEIRKVTAAMRTETLHTDQYHEIRLVTKEVTPTADGFHMVAALTLVGQTRDVPIDVSVDLGTDTLRAATTFAIKQTDFGIKPFSGGPAGTVKVADKVTFNIDAVAVQAAARPGSAAATKSPPTPDGAK